MLRNKIQYRIDPAEQRRKKVFPNGFIFSLKQTKQEMKKGNNNVTCHPHKYVA